MMKNRRRGTEPWKSSSLAALRVLSHETRRELGYLTSMATIEERAKGITVKLIQDEDQWKLVSE